MIVAVIFLLLLIGLAIKVAGSYNTLQTLSQDVKEKASNIQVAVSNKHNQINQLIDTVKNYQNLEQVTQLKVSQDMSGAGLENSYKQTNAMFSTIQGIADKFPNLKASEQYHRLVDSIKECEKDVQQRRERYNYSVKIYNQKRLRIPTIFIAKSLGLAEAPYMQFDPSGLTDITTLKDFKTDDAERIQQLFPKTSPISIEPNYRNNGFIPGVNEHAPKTLPNDNNQSS